MLTEVHDGGIYAPLPDITKIAVLRANRIGDFVVTLPALEALRAAYPHAEIVLLGRRWHADLLAGRPGPIDRVVPIPPYHGVGEPEDHRDDPALLARFFGTMATERFDLALQLHGGGGNSNPFIGRLGARHTAGLRAEGAPPLDRWLPYIRDQVEIVRYLEVVGLVGARTVGLEPHLTVTAADRDEALAALPPEDRPLVAIHPGATDPRRRWSAAHFGAVGARLAAHGARVVLVGDASERALTATVAGLMATPPPDLAGRLSLGGLLGLLARCQLVIGNDSGPRHLAEAVGTATVSVYWGQNLLHYGPLGRARHRPLVSWRETCPTCGGDADAGCGHTESWVDEVPVATVLDAALALLAQDQRRDG
jgi:ADP-heptose:LPS heptosyltransferase